jgi:CrcB protein
MTALLVIIGAGLGAPSRFLLDQYLRRFIKYPYGILVVNVFGSFVIGLTVAHPQRIAMLYRVGSTDNMHALVAIGFAGAFTTWSTFILDLYLAYELKQYKSAVSNLLLSITFGIMAVALGMHLAP